MKFRVSLTTLALMRGSIEIEAETAAQAEELAIARSGDVPWSYEGACEGEQGPSVQDCVALASDDRIREVCEGGRPVHECAAFDDEEADHGDR